MARVLCVGAALQDVYLIDRDDFGANVRGYFNRIALGDKLDIDQIQFSIGGGAANAATTFARYGHETIFMGCIANDPAGAAVVDALDQDNIDTSYITYLDNTSTGYSVIMLTPTGERSILTCRGASAQFSALNPADLDSAQPDWLYVTTLRGDMQMLDQLFTRAKKLGAHIMFNPGKGELAHPRKLTGLLSDVDVLLLNQDEAKQLVSGNGLVELGERLQHYVPTAIITASQQGAIAATANQTIRVGLYEDTTIKDTTGAGDAFGSGFLAAFADGRSLTDSLAFASANSTSVVQHIGSRTGIIGRRTRLHQMPIQEII